jgi:CDP-diacylglycerol---serine O-phosphatidyltransferase
MHPSTSKRSGPHRLGIPLAPTFLTLGNGVCGLASASYAAHATSGEAWPLIFAGALIFIAMIFDALDGAAARLLRQTSRFGAELESLCDAVSFGVAPALLLIRLGRDFHPAVLWAIAALYLVAVLLRLARFNLEAESDDRHEWFTGLPSPAAGGMIAALAIVAASGWPFWLPTSVAQLLPSEASVLRYTSNAAPVVALLMSALMVSRVPYPHTVNQIVRGKLTVETLALILFAIVTALALGPWAAPVVLAVFMAVSPVVAAWQLWTIPAEITGPEPAVRRFRFRARRADPPMPNGNGKAAPLAPEKHRSDDRVRVSKSRKVRM